MLDTLEIAVALKSLKVQMSAAGLLPAVGTSGRLDHLVAGIGEHLRRERSGGQNARDH